MANAKNKRTQYISQGTVPTISRSVSKARRRDVTMLDKRIDAIERVIKGKAHTGVKSPWITIRNPNDAETNRRYIRVRADMYYIREKEKASK